MVCDGLLVQVEELGLYSSLGQIRPLLSRSSACGPSMASSGSRVRLEPYGQDGLDGTGVGNHEAAPVATDLALRFPGAQRPAHGRQGTPDQIGEVLAADRERNLDVFRHRLPERI